MSRLTRPASLCASSAKSKQATLKSFFGAASAAKKSASDARSDGGGGGSGLLTITEGFGDFKPGYTDEGRVITMEYESFFLVLVYVPNSGQKLERLTYRLEKWDPDFRAYLTHLAGSSPPARASTRYTCQYSVDR